MCPSLDVSEQGCADRLRLVGTQWSDVPTVVRQTFRDQDDLQRGDRRDAPHPEDLSSGNNNSEESI